MIKTLTLNPAVDKAVTIERFAVGSVNRIQTVRLDAGGKGLNVARVLQRLGAPTLAVAPVAGSPGRFLAERLAEEGIAHDLRWVEGETRTNLKVVDPVFGTHTDINEPGPTLSPADLEQVGETLLANLAPGDWVVFSGSVPRGVPRDVYARWIARVQARGGHTVLDADGELFVRGVEARPNLIKPNLSELEAWVGAPLRSNAALFEAVERLREAGAQNVAVSLGRDGAWLFVGDQAWYAPGLKVDAKSTVGAGDALVAALTWGFAQGADPSTTLARAVATATASVVRAGTGAGDPRDIETFLAQVTVESHPIPWRKP